MVLSIKEFEDGKRICPECGRVLTTLRGFRGHIKSHSIFYEYVDNYSGRVNFLGEITDKGIVKFKCINCGAKHTLNKRTVDFRLKRRKFECVFCGFDMLNGVDR